MDHSLSSAPAAPAVAPAAATDRSHWTPERQRLFLLALIASGNVTRAARTVGMSRSSAHRLRARLADTPFDRAWASALRLHAEQVADPFAPDRAARRR